MTNATNFRLAQLSEMVANAKGDARLTAHVRRFAAELAKSNPAQKATIERTIAGL